MNGSTPAFPSEQAERSASSPTSLALEVGGRGRTLVTVDPAARPAVGDLADALGLPGPIQIDGRAVDRRTPLVAAGVVHGSQVTTSGRDAADPELRQPPVRSAIFTVEAGPDAAVRIELAPGRHVVGRAVSADVRIDDPGLELHHLVVDVGPAGRTTIVQVAGRLPVREVTLGPAEEKSATAARLLRVGGSRIRLGPTASAGECTAARLVACPGDPWRRSLHRPPRPVAVWAPAPVVGPCGAPSRTRSTGGVVAAACSLIGGVVIALVTRNPMFMLFGAVGVLGALGARIATGWRARHDERAQRLRGREDIERFRSALAEQRRSWAVHHASVARSVGDAVRVARRPAATLWERRSGHADAFAVTLGWGPVEWTAAVDLGDRTRHPAAGVPRADEGGDAGDVAAMIAAAQRFDDAPVVADLGRGAMLAVVGGDDAVAVLRALLVQLAVFTGPADWRLVVVADAPDEWAWVTWLPHTEVLIDARDGAAVSAELARLDDGDQRHTVVVTDRGDLLATRTGALRRYLDTAPSVAVAALVASTDTVPAVCRTTLEVGSLCAARWRADVGEGATGSPVHVAGTTEATARDVARRLAAIHDPEDPREMSTATPTSVGLGALLRRAAGVELDDPIAVAARWRRSDGHPVAPIGLTADGVIDVDLVGDGPHTLVAGTTGAGKSELLRTLVVSLAAASTPNDLTFVLIDYKGGAAFDACADLPHVVGMVTDLDEHLAARALLSLDAEIRRRERVLRAAGAEDHRAYRAGAAHESAPMPRLVVVVDEFAALAADVPGFVDALVGVAQRGRSLGIHLVLATQRPGGVVSDDIRANTNLRIALRLHGRADAMDVVGSAMPAEFPRGVPGRAMLRLGADEMIVFQAASSSVPHRASSVAAVAVVANVDDADRSDGVTDAGAHLSELEVLARSIRAAASLCDIERPFRPWLEPLPAHLDAEVMADLLPALDEAERSTAVGVIDDPREQRRLPLRWDPAAGNLALVGSLGSGTTTALGAVLASIAADTFVLDARGDGGLRAWAAAPWCVAVAGRHEAERRTRTIRHLADEVARRQSGGSAASSRRLILAVDGLAGVLDTAAGAGDVEEHAALLRILTDGLAVGVSTVATLERSSGIPMVVLGAFGQRWIFHLDDPNDAASFGVRATAVPPAIPGRVVVVGNRLEAQVALARQTLAAAEAASARSTSPIGTLPAVVDATTLPHSAATEVSTTLVVGVDFATLKPAELDVPTGEHVLVVGPARSGRSSALLTLVKAWCWAHPRGSLLVRCPRSSPVSSWAASAGAVVAADDAELTSRARSLGPGPWLLVVDDAERIDDDDQVLAELAAERRHDVMIIAAGRPEALRASYGSWTAVVRRSRIGVLLASGADTDGELFGEYLPRRLPIAARPGLAWLLDGEGRRLAQIALPASSASDDVAGRVPSERA